MIKIIVLVVLALVAGLLTYAATRPGSFRVQRSIGIQAAPDRIIPLISNFHQWQAWSPYEKMEPAMERTYAGAKEGVGAVYTWSGKKVGAGRMEILEVVPREKVLIKLDFDQPMVAHHLAEFTLNAQGGATQVTWAMTGPSPYFAKVMGLFFSMDKMVGKDFETGLANLKAVAER
ncbi:MAG: SRPBCC family protein [candidate division FCPU426 bacterium]